MTGARDYDEAFKNQLRGEIFGPWPGLRAMLDEAGVNPGSVEVRHVYDGGHGAGDAASELFEFTSPASIRFTARLKWNHQKSDATISEWRRDSP
jgi:hypothetical protein